MALINSLTSGISALKSFTKGMEVIGDNIANVNTTAYKSSRVEYTDSFSNMLRGSTPSTTLGSNTTSSQVGMGTSVQSVSTNFGRGFIDNTGVETDFAIAGDGFFKVIDPVNNQEYATRAGNLRIDDRGYVTNNDGYRLQGLSGGELQYDAFLDSRNNLVYKIRDGFPTDVDNSAASDLNVKPAALSTTTGTIAIPTEAPTGFSSIPLDSLGLPFALSDLEAALGTATPTVGSGTGFSFGGPFTTLTSIESQIEVDRITAAQFDRAILAENAGAGLSVSGNNYTSVTALRNAVNDGTITEAAVDTALAGLNTSTGIVPLFTTLSAIRTAFDNGVMTTADLNAALAAQNITIDGVAYDGATAGQTWDELNANYKLNPATGDSYTIAELNDNAPRVESFNMDLQGNVNISLSDGNSYAAGKIMLMTFNDPQALVREGNGLYTGFDAAGLRNSFLDNNPGVNGVGQIIQGSLESSNVDLTGEFANMITAQRSFQAGSRIVTVSDEILNEVVNLKR